MKPSVPQQDLKSAISVAQVDFHRHSAAIRAIREQVFVHEQHVPVELEWDGLDESAIQLLARVNERAVGTARLLPDGKIGRMAVLASWRHRGVGRALMTEVLRIAGDRAYSGLYLDAQIHALAFYRKFGFAACSDVFMDAGIPHRRMRCTLDAAAQ